MWLIFEGLDKVGKTTLEWEFLKQTNYKHIVIDRGPASYMAFDEIFDRSTLQGDREFVRQCSEINQSDDIFIINCYVNKDIAHKRLLEHNETCPYNYVKAQKILQNIITKFYNIDKIINIDTSIDSIETSVKKIITQLKDKGVLL